MTKVQRARLAALTAQATRTAADSAEFTTLTALAAAHPDVSKDTDAPAAAAAAAPANSPAQGETANGPAASSASSATAIPGGAPAPAAATAASNTLASFLQTALTAGRSRVAVSADLVAARATIGTLTAERDTARTERDDARTSLATAQAALATVAAFFGLAPTALSGLDAAAATKLLGGKISEAATEQVAAFGFNVGGAPLPKAATGDGNPNEMTSAEFSALTPAEKMKFSVRGGRLID